MTPKLVGVLGGGRMGAGIAHAFLIAGSTVRLAEVNRDAAAAARQKVVGAVEASAARGVLRGPVDSAVDNAIDAALARLQVTVGPESLAGCELVIEAVPENPALKAQLLATLSAVLFSNAANPADSSTGTAGPAPSTGTVGSPVSALAVEAVIATNTSSLPIGELAAAVDRPDRFVGLHFFNPVPASSLVEIVVGPQTSPDVVRLARGWVTDLCKTPIVVRDSPGFASSRLGLALGLEAIRMVEEGVAAPEDIDAAMTLGYRHPVGPLRLTDIVGLDVRLAIAEHLASTLGDRFAPPRLLRDKVAAGELGRKTGKGFYTWESA